jgi:hypothetical protein
MKSEDAKKEDAMLKRFRHRPQNYIVNGTAYHLHNIVPTIKNTTENGGNNAYIQEIEIMSEILKNAIESIKIEAEKLVTPGSHYQMFEMSQRLKHIRNLADIGVNEMKEGLSE